MKKQIVTLFLCLMAGVAFAQHSDDGKIAQLKKDYLKKELNLSDADAEKFFPVYDRYGDEKEILKMEQRLEFKKFQAIANPTEAESKAFTNKMIELEQKEVDLLKKYTAEFEKIIGAQKTALLFIAEVEFKKQMLHAYHERKSKDGEEKPMKQQKQ